MLGTTNAEDQKQLDALDKLLEKDPHDIKVLMEKAFILYYCFRDHEAITIYKKIIELAPNFIDAYFWMAECMRDHLANFNEAIAAINIALTLDPNRADCHEILAWCILSLYNETPIYFYHIKKAIELEPTWISPRISLVESLINIGELSEAQQELESLKTQIKSNPEIFFDENLWNMETHYECMITGRYSDMNTKAIEDFQHDLKTKFQN